MSSTAELYIGIAGTLLMVAIWALAVPGLGDIRLELAGWAYFSLAYWWAVGQVFAAERERRGTGS